MLAATMGSAMAAAHRSSHDKFTRFGEWRKARWLIFFLHLAQPCARAWGRLNGWWALRNERIKYPTTHRVYGNLTQRDAWLRHLAERLRDCGWVARVNHDWEDLDIEVDGPGPVRLQLYSVYEEDLERSQHYVRYRIASNWRPRAIVQIALLAALFACCALKVFLWPLALPLASAIFVTSRARQIQTAALSQLAIECAEPLGMTAVQKH
jgi:hypothetical protein